MKKIANRIFTLLILLELFTVTVFAQSINADKTDKLIFLNGSVKEGKVIAFINGKVQFTYTNETLNYEFSKKEIEKIQYASGRTEIIAERKNFIADTIQVVSKNRVAVIPMQYIGNGNETRKEDMGFQLQEIVITYLSNSAAELKYVDASEINAQLIKAGAIDSGLRRYTPKELAAFLHVEYVIMGTVQQDNGRMLTNIAGNGNSKDKLEHYGNEGKYTSRQHYVGSVSSNQQIETRVSLSIYNEAGEKLYSKSRHSLLSDREAYRNTIHFLLKRTALYKR